MAHYKRRRARVLATTRHGLARSSDELAHHHFTNRWPESWDILHHRRPTRRAESELERRVIAGEDPDDIVWPLNKKPHAWAW